MPQSDGWRRPSVLAATIADGGWGKTWGQTGRTPHSNLQKPVSVPSVPYFPVRLFRFFPPVQ
jgi:hypothetical protein